MIEAALLAHSTRITATVLNERLPASRLAYRNAAQAPQGHVAV
jgi:hypothetical protein